MLSGGLIEHANCAPEIQTEVKQNYLCQQSWQIAVSSVLFKSEAGEVSSNKGVEALHNCALELSSLAVVWVLKCGQCQLWFRMLRSGHSYPVREVKRMKHLLPTEKWNFCLEICFNNDVSMVCSRWLSATNIFLAKQYLNQSKLKAPVVLIISSVFLLVQCWNSSTEVFLVYLLQHLFSKRLRRGEKDEKALAGF